MSDDQAPFFRNALGPFQRGSETSRQAAFDNYPRSGTQRRRVLDAIRNAGDDGMTRDEVAGTLGLSSNSVRPRVKELLGAALIRESGKRRLTQTGSMAAVLVAVDLREAA